jgi:hypothetical protein
MSYTLILGGSRYAIAWKHWLVVEKTAHEHVARFGAPSAVWDGGQHGIDGFGQYLARDFRVSHRVWIPSQATADRSQALAARTRQMVASADRATVRALVFPMLGQKNPGSNLLYALMQDIVGDDRDRLVRRFVEP